VENKYYLPDLRLTVDFEDDLKFIQSILDHFNGWFPDLDEVVSYCRSLPQYPKVKDDALTAQEIKDKIKFR
jgi:spore coat polysaccharide biosynthesis protein SpsF (cytidylyltransferase family)